MRQKWTKGMAAPWAFGLIVALLWLTAGETPAQAAPAAPTNLAVVLTAPGTAKLTWTATGTINSFTIQRADFVAGVKTYSTSGTARSYTITDLTSGNTYYFRMRTNSLTGSSAYSPIVTLAVP